MFQDLTAFHSWRERRRRKRNHKTLLSKTSGQDRSIASSSIGQDEATGRSVAADGLTAGGGITLDKIWNSPHMALQLRKYFFMRMLNSFCISKQNYIELVTSANSLHLSSSFRCELRRFKDLADATADFLPLFTPPPPPSRYWDVAHGIR